jgi:hypothetical protein
VKKGRRRKMPQRTSAISRRWKKAQCTVNISSPEISDKIFNGNFFFKKLTSMGIFYKTKISYRLKVIPHF